MKPWQSRPAAAIQCGRCRHFEARPQTIERLIPGLAALSSAHGASRANDGLCLHHDRHVPATARCAVAEAMEATLRTLPSL